MTVQALRVQIFKQGIPVLEGLGRGAQGLGLRAQGWLWRGTWRFLHFVRFYGFLFVSRLHRFPFIEAKGFGFWD